MKRRSLLATAMALPWAISVARPARAAVSTMLNASYDISRELFAAINPAFAAAWKTRTGQDISIEQSHGGSSRQARAVLEGLQADVVTFNQEVDIQILHDRGQLIPADWKSRLPYNSSPYYSLPAFLVRAGNPKGIKDWDDLVKEGTQVLFPNPKTSGNARYTYLAAYAHALDKSGGDQAAAEAFVKQLMANVPVFDTGGRGATTTFVERELGDALLTFEAEVNGIRREYGEDSFEVVIPSTSIQADFPVAVVDAVADQRGSRDVATAYLEFLYTPEGQTILAEHYNRVRDETVAAKFAARFPPVRLFTVDDVFGGWAKVNQEHLAEGGILDRVLVNR
ncbi:MAG TPA: thiosulfate ABC transporter substrate-binding protein CysP [Geminicoccus sp.]|jgi:sulfate transport system substrate-binding protein|uniref:thiosulfate ABC transporter substrate-binding protein CysP n=1 Tax=Geminicoccus sp. TaxID=2024832 RepID=UPI002E32153E|nr:thiosulfate ABC transporter substrate-binding protein CysP [Geminicoccus sp.]HEX2525110.1 thiosulfate ABC transporter substrate-binding protein CysP [Geminicoccus sp.]